MKYEMKDALERTIESGEMDALRQAHAKYFGNIILNPAGNERYSEKALFWLNWLERQIDNVRATLSWSLAATDRAEFGAGLVWSLAWFCYRRGNLSEGRMWTKRLLASLIIPTISVPHALVLIASGMLTLWHGEPEAALEPLEQGLTIETRLENKQMLAARLLGKDVSLINMGKDNAARPLLEEAQALFKQHNLQYFYIFPIVHLGNAELGLRHPEQARAYHKEALAEARVIDENWLIAFALDNLGEVAHTQGQFELSRKRYEERETLLSASGGRGDAARFVHNLGYIAHHEGEFELAESQFRKSPAMFRRLGNRRGIAESLAGLAGLETRQGATQWGATLLGAAESLLLSTGGAWWPADRVEVERNRDMMKSALGAEEFAQAEKTGAAMNMDQAIAFASNKT